MRNLKRVLSLALALVMVLGMMVITTSAATYTDADEITEVEAVEVLSAIGMVGGSNGAFNPNDTFTREAAAKLLTYMLIGPNMAEKLAGTDVFTDVDADRWSAGYIAYCANLGYITGVGNDKFNPSGVLKDIELGKLVLCALGYDAAKYTGTNWAAAVTIDLLDADLVETVTGEAISREDACAMILAAMKKIPASSKGWYYEGTEKTLGYFESYTDAYLAAKEIVTGFDSANLKKDTSGSLLKDVYKVDFKDNDTDAFGRPAVSYKNNKQGPAKIELVYAENADYTITLVKPYTADEAGLTALVADVIKATGVKKMNATPAIDGGKVVVDGKACADKAAVVTAMGAAAKKGTVMELFMAQDGLTVEDIIVTCAYVDTVKEVTEANAAKEIDASIELNGGLTYKTDAFAEKDVVLYTKAWNGTAYEIQTIEKATSITGTLTAYTSDGKYTIDGEVYEISPATGAVSADTVKGKMGKEQVYALDQKGAIVAVGNVAGTVTVIKDYAVITDTNVKLVADSWGDVSAVNAQVKVVLSDGTAGTYDLPLTKVTTGTDKGDYVLKFGNTTIATIYDVSAKDGDITTDEGTAKTALKTALEGNKVYTYTVSGTEISFAASLATFNGEENTNGVAFRKNMAEINKASTTITTFAGAKTVIANEDTIFVLSDGKGGYVVKTGIAALEDTKIASDAAQVIVNITAGKDADGKLDAAYNLNVATVVFATGTAFDDASAIVTTDSYIYIDGTYTTTVNAQEKEVYTYVGVKADGSEIAVTGEKGLAEGIYEYNTDKEIDDSNKNTNEVTVGVIAGTTVKLGDKYETMTDSAKVVVVKAGAEFETGAKVFYLTDKGSVALVYVTEAAE